MAKEEKNIDTITTGTTTMMEGGMSTMKLSFREPQVSR
jgi:uncharacterized protein (DUF39 family)